MAHVDMSHMACIARRLVAEHRLTVAEVMNPRQTRAKIKETPSVRKVKSFKKKGQWEEEWGPSLVKEYDEYLKSHKIPLMVDYPKERAWWPTALHVLIGPDMNGTLDPELPWLGWFEAILGQPYGDFPPELDWKVLIHQVWLDRTRQWRFEWESHFCELYPDADKLESLLLGTGGGNTWGDWRLLSYVRGFATVEGVWEEDAFRRLAEDQKSAEIFAVLGVG